MAVSSHSFESVCIWAHAHPSEALFERHRSMQVNTETVNSQSRPRGGVQVDGDTVLTCRLYSYEHNGDHVKSGPLGSSD